MPRPEYGISGIIICMLGIFSRANTRINPLGTWDTNRHCWNHGNIRENLKYDEVA